MDRSAVGCLVLHEQVAQSAASALVCGWRCRLAMGRAQFGGRESVGAALEARPQLMCVAAGGEQTRQSDTHPDRDRDGGHGEQSHRTEQHESKQRRPHEQDNDGRGR